MGRKSEEISDEEAQKIIIEKLKEENTNLEEREGKAYRQLEAALNDLSAARDANRKAMVKIEELRAKLKDQPLTMKQVAQLIMDLNAMRED